jgi:hypothetical protein
MKKRLLINIAAVAAMGGMGQTSAANTQVGGMAFSSYMMNQELSALPKGSRMIFHSDYNVNPSEDTIFTPACHIEPSMPTGEKVTKAGTEFVLNQISEVRDGEDVIIVISGNSKTGQMVMIHCDKTNLPEELQNANIHEKGLSIGAAVKGLRETQNIELIIEQAAQ